MGYLLPGSPKKEAMRDAAPTTTKIEFQLHSQKKKLAHPSLPGGEKTNMVLTCSDKDSAVESGSGFITVLRLESHKWNGTKAQIPREKSVRALYNAQYVSCPKLPRHVEMIWNSSFQFQKANIAIHSFCPNPWVGCLNVHLHGACAGMPSNLPWNQSIL